MIAGLLQIIIFCNKKRVVCNLKLKQCFLLFMDHWHFQWEKKLKQVQQILISGYAMFAELIMKIQAIQQEKQSLFYILLLISRLNVDCVTISAVDRPPFEVKKQGWGEFQIMIRIYFQHPTMPHIQIPHFLKLHHTHASGPQAAKKPLCSETYDEIVFTQLDQHIQKMIKGRQSALKMQPSLQSEMLGEQPQTVNPQQSLKSITHYTKFLTDIKPEDHRTKLSDALNYILFEIKSSEDKLRNADSELQKVYDEIYGNLV